MKKSIVSCLIGLIGCGVIAIAAAQPVLAEAAKPVQTNASIGTALKKIAALIRKGGFQKLPSAAAALSTNKLRKGQGAKGPSPQDVSGTPPLLTAIAESTAVENIFWRPNVVAAIAGGVADQTQCGEFFAGATDGVSSGLRVCELAEGIGFSFQSIVDAETNLCYLKSFPTKKNLQSGGVTITRGRSKLPNNDFTQLFAAGDTSRLIKINTQQIDELGLSEQNIFVKIPSRSANKKGKNLYQAEIYSCVDGSSAVDGFNQISVSENGKLTLVTSDISDAVNGIGNTNIIQGQLDADNGTLKWDTTKQRTASIDNVQSLTDTFKSSIKITSDNLISIKRRNFYQSIINQQFSISKFTGTSAFSTAFLEGAYKGNFIDNGQTTLFSGATEFRDTFYAAAPNASLASRVNVYDLASDPFYASGPEINTDTSGYSCTARGDIEVNIISGSRELVATLKPCVTRRLSDMDFCSRSTLVTQAVQNFANACAM